MCLSRTFGQDFPFSLVIKRASRYSKTIKYACVWNLLDKIWSWNNDPLDRVNLRSDRQSRGLRLCLESTVNRESFPLIAERYFGKSCRLQHPPSLFSPFLRPPHFPPSSWITFQSFLKLFNRPKCRAVTFTAKTSFQRETYDGEKVTRARNVSIPRRYFLMGRYTERIFIK